MAHAGTLLHFTDAVSEPWLSVDVRDKHTSLDSVSGSFEIYTADISSCRIER